MSNRKTTYTKRETLRLHKKMWNWLAENSERQKRDWPDWEELLVINATHCLACLYDNQKGSVTAAKCQNCPIDWEISKSHPEVHVYMCEASLYGCWRRLPLEDKRRSILAKKIANLMPKNRLKKHRHKNLP